MAKRLLIFTLIIYGYQILDTLEKNEVKTGAVKKSSSTLERRIVHRFQEQRKVFKTKEGFRRSAGLMPKDWDNMKKVRMADNKAEHYQKIRKKLERDSNFSSIAKRVLARNKENEMDKNLYRVRRQIVQCEVDSLSCQSCCGNVSTSNCNYKTKLCRCDAQCTFYDDCCVDYVTFCGQKRNISLGVDSKALHCVKSKNVNVKAQSRMIWIIDKCPRDRIRDKISHNCEVANELETNAANIRNLTPVVDDNNVLYRNEFCAKCNGIQYFEYLNISITTKVPPSSSNMTLAELVNFTTKHRETGNFLSFYREPSQRIRECHQFKPVCPTREELNNICSTYSHTFWVFEQDLECFTTNNASCYLCFSRWCLHLPSNWKNCEIPTIFSPPTNSFLLTIRLPERSYPPEETARPQASSVLHVKFDVPIVFKAESEPRFVFNISASIVAVDDTISSNENFTKIQAQSNNRSNVNTTQFKLSSRPVYCIGKKTYSQANYTLKHNGKFYIHSTRKTYGKYQVFEVTNKSVSVCERISSTCIGRKINLTSDQYVKYNNSSIFYKKEKVVYDVGQYYMENGNAVLCILPDSSKHEIMNSNNSNDIGRYLTFVCLILSLTCLFLVILTYLMFSELRNLPGKNILSLAASLFLAKLVWLIPDWLSPSTVCHVIAAARHYLFLVSFVAMAAIAWNTYSVFAGKEVQRYSNESKRRDNKKFFKYSAIVWGAPVLFVGACTGVDGKVYAVYTNDRWCWFDNTQAQQYLFVLPIGVLLLFNIIFFVLTVFHIQKDRWSTRSIRSNQNARKIFWIYLKLSALMGFSWLFGFVHLIVGDSTHVFSYLFITFASLQGVYIFLAFVAKKAILEKYKNMFRKDNRKSSSHVRNPGINIKVTKV